MNMLKTSRPRTLTFAPLACVLALALMALGAANVAGASSKQSARASASYLTGIGDQQTEMFSNPLWGRTENEDRALHRAV